MAAGDSIRRGGDEKPASGFDRGVLTLAAWGFVAVMAVVTGFAAWQFAPRQPVQSARAPAEDITAAIGPTRSPAARPPAGDAQAVMRELDTIRQELLELRRLMGRADQKSDLLSQRITLVEDQAAILTAGLTSMAQRGTAVESLRPAAEAPRVAPGEAAAEPARPAERVTVTEPRAAAEARPPGTDARAAAESRAAPPGSAASPAVATAPAVPGTPSTPAGPAGPAPARVNPMPSVAIGLRPPGAAPEKPVEPTAAPETTGAIPAKTEHGVDLGGFRNLTQLRKAWTDLEAKQPRLAKGMAPLAQARETPEGLEVRLIGGPFPSPADAARFCAAARAAGVACAPSGYAGQPAR